MMMHNNRRRSVLIAENDRAYAQWLKLHLERAGIMVFVAYDGEQAAILAARQRYDLIFINPDLPVISGSQLIHHVRHDLNLTEVPIAICRDADSNSDVQAVAINDEFVRVFQQPIDPSSLVEYVWESAGVLVSAH